MSNDKNIEIVVELLKKNKIHYVVISPGGTNIPLVRAIQDDDFFTCYSVVDERSAVYFAIGIYLRTGETIAMSCTSAQATRNYIPGLTEAFYKKVPILAITMAKHSRFTYQEYMQAPDQTSLPADCVKESYSLPYISDQNDIYHSIRVANEAICELKNHGNGPVQLCIPWLDFSLEQCEPTIRHIEKYGLEDDWNVSLAGKKVMIVIGEHRPFTEREKAAISAFCKSTNSVVYTNHLSNFHNPYSVDANLVFATMTEEEFEKEYVPDTLITIGGQTGDYPIYLMLSKTRFSNIEHWRVNQDGRITDTYDKLTKIFECSESIFFEKMASDTDCEHDYFERWNSRVSSAKLEMKLPYSNASIAQYLHNRLPKNSILQFSILNSLRIWNFFPIDPSVECYSNVGAFGIDGGMSTLIGQSVVTDQLCFMVIGDLAFFYDMNSIGIRHVKNNLRILLINNNGGIEFKLGGRNNEDIDRYIAAGNHFRNAKGWAETCEFEYMSAATMDEFEECSHKFLEQSSRPMLLEVFVSDYDEADAYHLLMDNNSQLNVAKMLKNGIKKVSRSILRD